VSHSTATHMFAAAALLILAIAAGVEAADRPNPLAPYEGIPEGYIVVQGDMLIRIDGGRGVQGGFFYNLWPAGVVPYDFDTNVDSTNRDAMRLAMNEIQDVCAAIFIPRVGHDDYVRSAPNARPRPRGVNRLA